MVSNAFHRPNRPIQGSVSLYGNTYGVHLVVACDILMKCALLPLATLARGAPRPTVEGGFGKNTGNHQIVDVHPKPVEFSRTAPFVGDLPSGIQRTLRP